ncbi:MAG: enoyl-CoA hydratase/isomerase family protein [Hyphomicrobiaceae bacterium]|nr:MAG: enoyl-CoA hydratase/isomerase family protein [Hyphomicrobiaceae bacterium]
MNENMKQESATSDLIIRREGTAGRITLNRPKALNALNAGMLAAIAPALEAWREDPDVELIIIDGTGERGLCAGGDIRAMYDSRKEGSGFARTFWRDEYRLNAEIKRYPKPYVAFMDGIVMGGGIGLSAHGSHRIVTERSELAMPETGIGLIPDVGGTFLLSRSPGAVGSYLGLVGERMHGAGTIFAGFADCFVQSERLADLARDLSQAKAKDVDAVIARYREPPPPSELKSHAAEIDAIFNLDSLREIMRALDSSGSPWAQKTRAALVPRSPLALTLTHSAIRRAKGLSSLEAALNVEYRLVVRLFESGEFTEGVRALIIDKDKKPLWNPARLDDVDAATVAKFFATLPAREELGLAPR